MTTRFYGKRKDSGTSTFVPSRNSNGAHQPAAATPTRNRSNSYRPGMCLGDIAGGIDGCHHDSSDDDDAGNSSRDFDFGFDLSFHSPVDQDLVSSTPSGTPRYTLSQTSAN